MAGLVGGEAALNTVEALVVVTSGQGTVGPESGLEEDGVTM